MNQFADINSISKIVSIRDSFKLIDPKWQEAEVRLRKLLQDEYGTAMTLCLKTVFVPTCIHQGYISAKETFPGRESKIIDELSRVTELIPRSYCEYNPLYKQVIPYIAVVDKNGNIFTTHHENGKIEISFFGHTSAINISLAVQQKAAARISGFANQDRIIFDGFFYNPTDPVSSDHIGFIHLIEVNDCRSLSSKLPNTVGIVSKVKDFNPGQLNQIDQIIINNLKKA